MKTLLVTGASGFLGGQVCQLARSHWQVHGTYSQHPLNLPQVILHSLDLTDQARVQAFLGDLRPDAIIHTAAQAKPNRCEQDPADVSMESDRAFALGYAPRSVQAGLAAIAQSM